MSQVDEASVTQEFTTRLADISAKETVIKGLANFCIENPQFANNLVAALLARMRMEKMMDFTRRMTWITRCISIKLDSADTIDKRSFTTRLHLFYIVEIISHKKDVPFLKSLQPQLTTLFQYIIPQDGAGNNNLDTVDKVLRGWKERKTFPDHVLRNLDEYVKGIRRTAGNVTMSDADRQYALRKMEQDREGQKRAREMAWQRPVGETDEQEFDDVWEKMSDIQDTDWWDILEMQEMEALDRFQYYNPNFDRQAVLNMGGSKRYFEKFQGFHREENAFFTKTVYNVQSSKSSPTSPATPRYNQWYPQSYSNMPVYPPVPSQPPPPPIPAGYSRGYQSSQGYSQGYRDNRDSRDRGNRDRRTDYYDDRRKDGYDRYYDDREGYRDDRREDYRDDRREDYRDDRGYDRKDRDDRRDRDRKYWDRSRR